MKYFIDTECLEGTQKTLFGKTKPTIDLISIGVVCEDGREYYAISKDFNLKEAWNRHDLVERKDYENFSLNERGKTLYKKVYWIRENVLKPIWIEKCNKGFTLSNSPMTPKGVEKLFTYKNFKKLINKYGKTNKQIAEEVKEFCKPIEGHPYLICTDSYEQVNIGRENTIVPATYNVEVIGGRTNPEFYGYYSDYDWVVFCWLFGKMIDLPKGFPMYCIDLKQTLDEKGIISRAKPIINDCNYPKQTNKHNALADAKWNYELYKFLQNL